MRLLAQRYGVGPDYFDEWDHQDVNRELELGEAMDEYKLHPMTLRELQEFVVEMLQAFGLLKRA